MKKELGIFILLVVLCAIVAIINPKFLLAINLQNLTRMIGAFGIFSIGLGLVIITGGIDLSVGSVFALQGVVLAMMLREAWYLPPLRVVKIAHYLNINITPIEYHWVWPLAVLVTFIAVMGLGLFHGLMITRLRMQPFIVTLCGLLFYRGLARFFTD